MGGKLIIVGVAAGLVLSGLASAAHASDDVTVSDTRVIAARADLDASPSPAVYLDAHGQLFGLPGIRIDDPNANLDSTFQGQFFESQSGTWLSVVALNRSTLKPVYAKNYSCPQVVGQKRYDAGEKAAAPCIAAVQKDFTDNKLNEKHLVVATNFGEYGNEQAPYGVVKALKPIGVDRAWWWADETGLTPGTFSAVGVPGSKPGDAHQVNGNPWEKDTLAVRTMLVRNTRGLYDVMPNDRISFVTDAKASDADTHVVRIDEKPYKQKVSGGGYHVVWMNRAAAGPAQFDVQQDFFATQDKGRSEVQRMNDRIRDIAGHQALGFVVSVGQPLPKDLDYLTAIALDDLVDALEWLGATRNGAYGPLDRKTARGQSYSLVGWGAGPGVESTHQTKPALAGAPKSSACAKAKKRAKTPKAKKRARTLCKKASSVQGETRLKALPRALREAENNAGIAGWLSRDNQWRYAPTVTLDGDVDPDMPAVTVLYSEPGAWPGDDDDAFTRALADLGRKANLGQDPRAQYWTQAYSAEYWSNRLDDVRQAKYQQTPFYSAKVFESAQDQLVKEIKWVRETYGYYARLAKPYESAGLQTWAKMTAVADSIDKSLEVPNAQKVAANVLTITRAAAELAGELPGVGKAVSVAMASFDLAAEVAEVGAGEGLDDDYSAKVAELGEKTADRLDEATTTVGTTFPRIVVSDYAKLKRVGQCAGTSDACKDVNDWQLTPEGLKETSEQFRTSMSVMFYQSLMPAKYRVFYMGAGPRTQVNSAICALNLKDIVNGFKPWKDAPARASVPVRRYASNLANDEGLYNILAFGETKNDYKLFNELSYPSAGSLAPLFGTGKEQLGVDPEGFVRAAWSEWANGNRWCVWDKNSASATRDTVVPPAQKESLGHGFFKDVKARVVNDTGHTIWVAKYLEVDDKRNWQELGHGEHFDVSSDGWLPTMVRVGVMFENPAIRNPAEWQDELQFINPIGTAYVWHERTDAWSHFWPMDEKVARGSSGWKDFSYQSNGYPYNLWMKRDNDDPYYKYFTVAFSLRPSSPLPPPGPPWE
ncbi:MAG: hypothetical protein IPG68_11910 [Micrococcales bacterium]|nr:hypothetical protein [Micrococcales bacterium]